MKKLLFVLAVVIAARGSVLAAASDLPQPRSRGTAARTDFEKHGGERHRWKKGQALPLTLAEAGMLSDVSLVWTGLYKDGATQGFLFEDSQGGFLAVCTGPGLQTKDNPRRIDAPPRSRLFLGGLHYTKEEVEMVPAGSKTEEWLRKLLEEKWANQKIPEPAPADHSSLASGKS